MVIKSNTFGKKAGHIEMSEIFFIHKILEVAIEMEINGRKFYESLSAQVRDIGTIDTFTYLAQQEKEHELLFRKILGRMEGFRPQQDYTVESYRYIKDLADSSIFASDRVKDALIGRKLNQTKALEMGICFEKDSILFYSEIGDFVPFSDRETVEKIIAQEKVHLLLLTDIWNTTDDFASSSISVNES